MDWSQWGPGSISQPARKAPRKVAAQVGLVLEDVETGFVGEVIRTERSGGSRNRPRRHATHARDAQLRGSSACRCLG